MDTQLARELALEWEYEADVRMWGAWCGRFAMVAFAALVPLLFGTILVPSDTDLSMMMEWCWWVVSAAGGVALFLAAPLWMSWYELRRCRARVNELR